MFSGSERLTSVCIARRVLIYRTARGTSTGISFPNKLIRTLSSSRGSDSHAAGPDGKWESQVAIDPLSQVQPLWTFHDRITHTAFHIAYLREDPPR